MPTCAVSKNVSIPVQHEGSTHRSPRDRDDVRQAWKVSTKHREQVTSDRNAIEQLTRKVEGMRRRILGGSGGASSFPWQSPKELDPTKAVPKDTFVFISPSNSIVTTGLTDLVSEDVAYAVPGIWQAVQDVPAATEIGYNVPKLLSATGSNLADSEGLFWILWQEHNPCIGQ